MLKINLESESKFDQQANVDFIRHQSSLDFVKANQSDGKLSALDNSNPIELSEALTNLLDALKKSLNSKDMLTAFQKTEIVQAIITEFPNVTIDEVTHCFYKAKTGYFGTDFNRLDILVVCNWIRLYLEDEERKMRIHEFHKSSQKQLSEKTEPREYVSAEKLEEYSKQFEAELQKFAKKRKPVAALSMSEAVSLADFKSKISNIDSVPELKAIRQEVTEQIITCKESEVSQRQKQLRIVDERINFLMNND